MTPRKPNTINLYLDLDDVHQQPQEAIVLYSLVFALRPDRIFEVGSYKGGSARIIAEAMTDSGRPPTPDRLFMIDPQPRLTEGNAAFLRGKSTILAESSPAAYGKLPEPVKGFGMAFIDGDHSEEGVYADLVHAFPLLLPGAVVICHDSYYVPVQRGIDRAVNDAGFSDCGQITSGPVVTDSYEYGYRVLWGGLRMLRKPEGSSIKRARANWWMSRFAGWRARRDRHSV